jgi:hypothetical protein
MTEPSAIYTNFKHSMKKESKQTLRNIYNQLGLISDTHSIATLSTLFSGVEVEPLVAPADLISRILGV